MSEYHTLSTLSFKNELTMSSVEIAELTGKKIGHIHRDIKTQLIEGLHGFNTKDDPYLDHIDIKGIFVIRDERGFVKQINLDEDHTLTLITGYEVKARHAINKRWRELESSQFKMPQTFAEALRLAADTQEALDAAQNKIEADKPKVKFAEAVRKMEGSCKVGDFAKVIGTGRNRLFAQMRKDRILMIDNKPYQRYIEQGFFVVIEQIPYTDSDGKTHPAFTTMITGKGQVWLENKYRGLFGKEESGMPKAKEGRRELYAH